MVVVVVGGTVVVGATVVVVGAVVRVVDVSVGLAAGDADVLASASPAVDEGASEPGVARTPVRCSAVPQETQATTTPTRASQRKHNRPRTAQT